MTSLGAQTVVYHGLPNGAHGLRKKDPRAGLEAIDRFIDTCLVLSEALRWDVDVIPTRGDGSMEEGKEALGRVLGGPSRHTPGGAVQWRGVREDRVSDVLETLRGLGADYQGPKASWVANLRVRGRGLLRDPITGAGYPGAMPYDFPDDVELEPGRRLGVSLVQGNVGTGGSSLYLWLSLPADERLGPAARHIQEQVPVPLSPKQWRLWRPSPSGKGYFSRKIDSPLGQPL